MNKKFGLFVLVLTLLIGMLSFPSYRTLAEEKEYELYPSVQSINYGEGKLKITDLETIYFDKELDEETRHHAQNIFSQKDIILEEVGKKNADVSIILDKDLPLLGYDAYRLTVSTSDVLVEAQDTDAAFHALTSLKHILLQSEEELRSLVIEDYADTEIRGFIEGFYGVPWSNDDRKELMRFGGDFKMNAYIFAPKDDPYHNESWREPYPKDKIEEIREMVEVGRKSKTKFIWAIHPFMNNGVNFENGYEEDLQLIVDKFEQLYEVGVRQFGILADDVNLGSASAKNQARLLNDIYQWNQEKGDNYPLLFVPSYYNYEWAQYAQSYFDVLNNLPEDIHIMWTGDVVLGDIDQTTLDHFQSLMPANEDQEARKPLFWLNWPVNDINSRRLVLGKSEMLGTDVEGLGGVVTNPMQQAEASKGALFAVADYAWNLSKFDVDKNWQDSFKYIEKTAYEDLKKIAYHLNDPSPNIHDVIFDESQNIQKDLEYYLENIHTTNTEEIKDLQNIFKDIHEASINYLESASNKRYLEEVRPWILSLSDLSASGYYFLEAHREFLLDDFAAFKQSFEKANALYEQSKKYEVDNLSGPEPVEAGQKRIVPFIERVMSFLSPPVVDFEVSQNFVKPGEEIVLKKLTDIEDEAIHWLYPGAEKVREENGTLVIRYNQEGRYSLVMYGINDKGESKVLKKDLITVSKLADKGLKNLALGKETDVSSVCAPSEAGQYAVDNNSRTKWCANKTDDHYLIVDLGEESLLSSFNVMHAEKGGESASLNTKDFDILISNDGKEFKPVVEVRDNKSSVTEHHIPATHARYVKLDVITPTQSNDRAARIYEFEVHGLEGKHALPDSQALSNKEELETVLLSFSEYDKEDFTVNSWEEFQLVLSEAKVLKNDPNADQLQIDRMTEKLYNAQSSLVNISELKQLIDKMKNIEAASYTPESYEHFQEVYQRSIKFYGKENLTHEDLQRTIDALQEAYEGLEERKTDVEDEKLLKLLETISQLDGKKYTSESWSSLNNQIEEAKKILNNPNVSQQEIDDIFGKLLSSYESLELIDEDVIEDSEKEDNVIKGEQDTNEDVIDSEDKQDSKNEEDSKDELDYDDESRNKEQEKANNESETQFLPGTGFHSVMLLVATILLITGAFLYYVYTLITEENI